MSLLRRASRPAATAALSPLLIIVLLIIVLLGCAPSSSRPAAAARPSTNEVTGAVSAAPDAVWPYYAELSAARSPGYRSPRDVTIRNTDTATVVSTVRPPRPYQTFGLVTGTGTPDRWVVGAQLWHPRGLDNSAQPVALFTLVFDPASKRADARGPVVLSFPAAEPPSSFKGPFPPDGCAGPPVVISDGQTALCSGLAATPMNAGGAQEVGVWGFSARTGKLTARWNPHMICCLVTTDEFPVILWASPRGQLMIASGMSTANWGEELFLRTSDGHLRRLPWQGIDADPNTVPPLEPPVAW